MEEQPDAQERLIVELASLRRSLDRLNTHNYLRAHRSVPRMLGYTFLRGLAMGLGTVIGATILVSVAAYSLAQIDFIPIIGDWAQLIVQEIQTGPTTP
ncbi:DUF5665 domain-containing protein [Actibacterium sp.]|uniref:DUF5665 domain-containing protein n=1 Tax=Actibacterium sp. TaxID=1872125 RepID=UPI003569BE27